MTATATVKHTPTPGPWEYVPSNEHHGPYVVSEFGNTICDCYVMSNPNALSVRNGGDSKPIHHLAEMADPNARLIAAAPDLLAALRNARAALGIRDDFVPLGCMEIAAEIDACLIKAEGRAS